MTWVVASNEVYGAPVRVAATSASPASPRRRRAPAAPLRDPTGRPDTSCPAGRSRCRASSRTCCRWSARGQDAAIASIGRSDDDRRLGEPAARSRSSPPPGRCLRTMQQTRAPSAFGPGADATDRSGRSSTSSSRPRSATCSGRARGRGQVRAVARPGGEPAARGTELPLQPPDRPRSSASTGATLPAFPPSRVTDDYQFLSSPTTSPRSNPRCRATIDRGWHRARAAARLRRRERTGRPPDFPKQTGGWLAAPRRVAFERAHGGT